MSNQKKTTEPAEGGCVPRLVSPFDLWWANELSGIPPKGEHDHLEHIYRMCKIVWDRWEDVAAQIDCHSPEALLEEILLA